jgi:hypothetical protein
MDALGEADGVVAALDLLPHAATIRGSATRLATSAVRPIQFLGMVILMNLYLLQ